MKNKKTLSNIVIVLSVIAAVLSAIVSISHTAIWLAGTQWMLVSIILAIYAIYLNCCCTCGNNKND